MPILLFIYVADEIFPSRKEALTSLTLIGLLVIRLLPITSRFSNLMNQIEASKPLISEFERVLIEISERNETGGRSTATNIHRGVVKIDAVDVYRGGINKVRNKKIEILPGQLAVIKGRSGSGKSTLVKQIVLGASSNEGAALSPQVPITLDGSVRFNIEFFSGDLSIGNDLEKIIKNSGLYNTLISELANGLETQVFVGGNGLSGGQIKRLSVLRCLLSGRAVQIFDEPDSGLNIEAREELTSLIKDLKKYFTFVVVSHNETFEPIADIIIDLD